MVYLARAHNRCGYVQAEEAAADPGAADGCIGWFASVRERAEEVMGTHALSWNAMMRDAGATVRSVLPDRVFPLMKEYDVTPPHSILFLV